MNTQNITPWLPLFASSITAIITLVAVYLTNNANYKRLQLEYKKQEERTRCDLYRERGEELYLTVHKWMANYSTIYLNWLRVMHRKMTMQQLREFVIGQNEVDFEFGRVEMIIDVYFPAVRSTHDKAMECKTEINNIWFEFERQEGAILKGEELIAPFVNAQKKFEKAGQQLKDYIKQMIAS